MQNKFLLSEPFDLLDRAMNKQFILNLP